MNCYDEFATTNMFCAGSTHICTNSPLRDNMFSFWDQFSQLSFVGVAGIAFASWIISLLYKEHWKRTARQVDNELSEWDGFEEWYLDEFDEASEAARLASETANGASETANGASETANGASETADNASEKTDIAALKSIINEVATPRGTIGIFYDSKNESFAWFSNTKDIPYAYLLTVARRYMIDNNCTQVVESEETKKEDRNDSTNDKETVVEDSSNASEESDSDVFVKLKSRVTAPAPPPGEDEVVCSNTIRFSYRGKMADMEEYKRSFLTNKSSHKDIDFASFKAMNAKEE